MAWEEQRPERRQKADRNSKKSQDRGRGKKRERAQNKDFAKITYFFVILFIALMGYLVYFTTVKAKTFVNSPYNQRQDSFAQSVVRGDITDRNGNVLATTEVDEDGTETRELIHNFDGAGIIQGMHNINASIESFARSCFSYALDTKQDLWFATKDTISKKYDHTFKDIFQEIFDAEYKEKFEEAGITYFYTLIDDAVARVMKAEGGFIWACKNYDGDVMSDMVATAFGSLAMMTSVLVSPNGCYEYEAAHGTVQRHYYQYKEGKKTSTNPVATIFAWSGAFRKRGEMDGLEKLCDYADKLEQATIDTIESGIMTKDLSAITTLSNAQTVTSEEFLSAIRSRLEALLA